MFEFLFKYPAETFARGEITLTGAWWLYLGAVLVAALLVPSLLLYARVKGEARTTDRIVLSVARTTVFAIVLLALFQPMLMVSTLEPRATAVAVLLDDSLSMRIADQDAEARALFVEQAFHPDTGHVSNALSRRFVAQFFRFSSKAERLRAGDTMSYAGSKTDLVGALTSVRRELGNVAIAGLIVVSDGAVNEPASLDAILGDYKTAGIPITTVGVGQTRFDKDLEITRVSMPRRVLGGSSVAADVLVSHRGLAGRRVKLVVEDDDHVITMQEVELSATRPSATVRTHFTAKETGARRIRFRISPLAGEIVRENNSREVIVSVDDRRERILYFEGEPRFELKFMRRAVAKDDNLQIVSLIRTAESKYYRVGIDGPEELADGFPGDREALFGYRGLILGSVEASYFSSKQLRMIADFVSIRGGGLLVLGGRRAFAEGGYGGTPVAELLPVVLGPKNQRAFQAQVTVRPTQIGESHPLTRLFQNGKADAWETLPPLTALHPLYRTKRGAFTVLEGAAAELPQPLTVLAEQRFGRGRSLILNAQNTWLWQMHQDIPLEDQTHEIFWSQLLRWLVRSVPDPVSVRVGDENPSPREPVQLTAEVLDSVYAPRNNAAAQATIITPLGEEFRLPMVWQPDRDGIYQARFTPEHAGLYEVVVAVEDTESTATAYIPVGNTSSEYFRAEMREALLQRIATETGGRYYRAAQASKLAEEIPVASAGATVLRHLELWNAPAAFILLLALLAFEWIYRRLRGLV